MERNLSVELRPKKFSQLIGQEDLVAELKAGFSKRTPIGILLAGESGAGKTTVAEILALSVQCTHGEFGEPCDQCIADRFLFDIDTRPCANLGTVEAMKDMIAGIRNYPAYGPWRVRLLDEAHQIGTKAQDILLIPLEDEEARNIFILSSNDTSKIQETVKRRCATFIVPNINRDRVGELVESTIIRAEGSLVKPSGPMVDALLSVGEYRPGFIIKAIEKYLNGIDPVLAIASKDASKIDRISLIKAITNGDWEVCQSLLAEAQAADVDGLKTHVAAWFRKILLNPNSSKIRLEFAAWSINEIVSHNAATVYEASLQLSILTASIYNICNRINELRNNK